MHFKYYFEYWEAILFYYSFWRFGGWPVNFSILNSSNVSVYGADVLFTYFDFGIAAFILKPIVSVKVKVWGNMV